MSLVDIGAAWLRVGLFGFGGGPSVLPLIHHECVERYGWVDEAAYLDALAFGNAIPGPIAVKLAAHLGNVAGGWPGAVVAVVAMCTPGLTLMFLLAALWTRYKDLPAVEGVMRGVRPAIVGLLAYTVWELAPGGVRDGMGIAVAVLAFAALLVKVHPAVVIAGAMAVGYAFASRP